MSNFTTLLLPKEISSYYDYFSNEDKNQAHTLLNYISKEARKDNTKIGLSLSALVINSGQLLMLDYENHKNWSLPRIDFPEDEDLYISLLAEHIKEYLGFDIALHAWHKLHPFPFDINIQKKYGENHILEAIYYDLRFLFTMSPGAVWDNYSRGKVSYIWNCLCNLHDDIYSLALAKILFHESIFLR